MAVAWTSIPNGDVDVDSPLTTGLMTSLRDNPEGIAQRASGAPKIFSNAYDFQEFTSGSGNWTKPANAESGDRVVVQIVGAGAGGERSTTGNAKGGGGGAGVIVTYADIDDLPATVPYSIGAPGVGKLASVGTGVGTVGGNTVWGTASTDLHITAEGGAVISATDNDIQVGLENSLQGRTGITSGGQALSAIHGAGYSSVFGGGGGGRGTASGEGSGGVSAYAGDGGQGQFTGNAADGEFPGGGGGGASGGGAGDAGDGAGGVVRVWCIRDD